VRAGQGLARRPDGVRLVGLRPGAAREAGRAVDLGDLLPTGLERGGQARADAPRAFDRPDAAAGRLGAGEDQQPAEPAGISGDGHVGEDAARRSDDGGGVGVLVGVDPEHEVDAVGQERQGQTSSAKSPGPAPAGRRVAGLRGVTPRGRTGF
jgi:hypothetical protein